MPTALILGASSDMAIAIARKFASHQYNIQLAARNTEPLQALRSDLGIRYNVQCTTHSFDALNYASHQSFFDQLSPKPDVTICVFGYLGAAMKARSDWQEAERIIQTNYTGAVSILDKVANYYAQQKQGTIAGISSVAGERGRQSNYHYGSAKAGFTAYLSGLRNRLFHEGVHVVTVQPGFIYTRMTENLQLPKLLTGHPADVANTVYSAVRGKKNIVYVKWFWRWIMLIICSIPEFMFKKMKM
jgi:decaprenylphospho-beta-D-erythro-pentofuranosid-2-ulose 2-reductase